MGFSAEDHSLATLSTLSEEEGAQNFNVWSGPRRARAPRARVPSQATRSSLAVELYGPVTFLRRVALRMELIAPNYPRPVRGLAHWEFTYFDSFDPLRPQVVTGTVDGDVLVWGPIPEPFDPL